MRDEAINEVTVSIIEDSEIHAELLKELLLKHQFELVSMNTSGKKGIESARQYHPDVVLLDFQLSDITGLEVARRIRAYSEGTKIFALTAHTETNIVERIVSDKNIDAIAIKGSSYFEDNFKLAIRLVAHGESYLDPSLLKILRRSKRLSGLQQLTKREFEVFIQTTLGKSDEMIAEDLSVEILHIKNLKSRISKKIKRDEAMMLRSKLHDNVTAG